MDKKFAHIDTWVFDLDNTLYCADTHTFGRMVVLMNQFLADHFKISYDEAAVLRKGYFDKHGTTLRAVQAETDIDVQSFLDYAHNIDIAHVPSCPVLQTKLALLPGRKVIFTNGTQSWARNLLLQLDIAQHFDGSFTVEDAPDFRQKPHGDVYRHFFEKMRVKPETACFFEDSVENLKPAYDIGMTTVWIHKDCAAAHHLHVHDSAPSMAAWLTRNLGD